MAPSSGAEQARGGAVAVSPAASVKLVMRPPYERSRLARSSTRKARERLAVLVAGACDDLGRQFRSRCLLVPVERLEIVAYKLFVEARRADALAVAVGGPETRGVRRQHFVDQREAPVAVDPEFKLGVGD